MNLFKLYNNLDEYYDIQRRINKPKWTQIASKLFNTITTIVTKDISKDLKNYCAIDTHVHTEYSHCSFDSVEKILINASKKGLSGICIMDHHTIEGYKKALEVKQNLEKKGLISKDFIIIPGIEYTTPEGHIGAMFADKDIYFKSKSAKEVVDEIHNMGALAICVHPYRKKTGIKDLCKELPFDAVEYASGSIFNKEYAKMNLEETKNLPYAKLGASDAHFYSFLGSCWTEFPKGTKTLEDVKNAILNKKTIGHESENIHRIRKVMK